MIVKTEAIVLKSMKFRDTSRIVTFYTKSFGKLKAIAKGAREIKSKFGSSLQPLSYVDLIVYKKENRDLHLISQCDIRLIYKKIYSDIESMAVGLAMAELLDKVAHEEEENARLFALVTQCLKALDVAKENYPSILYAFELRMASEFGFGPSLRRCANCGKFLQDFQPHEVVVFQIARGSVLCPACSYAKAREKTSALMHHEGLRATLETIRTLDLFLTADLDSLTSIAYDESMRNEIDETLRLYLRHHFEDLKPLKSTEVFQKLLA